ncbi:MAG TPA: tetratricopeptide repeat protein [Acidobacteriaceae bacterium]|nr:tetratricopeptide repeat protein [Acidobacteriaceae bacterium]
MLITVEEGPVESRRLILRDSLNVLGLLLTITALFAVTFFLFRSFSAHRADLAQRWSARGRMALQAGKPDEAITALRTALVYAPGTRDDELLLAEALEQTNRPEEAEESYQYLTGLWTADPGYGPINLQLARLERKRDQPQDAINSYRAAIYGTWQGGGLEERAAVRLELAQYLIAQHDLEAAHLELLIAGGDAPETYERDMEIGSLLEQAIAAGDAETYYRRALQAAKRNREERDAARDAIARIEAAQAAAAVAAAQEEDSAAQKTPAAQTMGAR